MNVAKHFGKFTNLPQATPEQLLAMADGHFHSMDDTQGFEGREIFAINRGMAHWLLHNCQHEVPSEKEGRSVSRLSYEYGNEGARKSWPKEPIVIDCDQALITNGVKRLYAIAYMQGKAGVCMPMEFISKEEF